MRSGVDAEGDTHDFLEVAGEMTLIGEANRGSHLDAVETIAEKAVSYTHLTLPTTPYV